MMQYDYDYGGMMGGDFALFGPIIGLIVVIDLVLLGIWLWQNISKK